MRVFLIRHGYAYHNDGFHTSGPSAYQDVVYRDSKLTDIGHRQTIGNGWLIYAQRIYCSPLFRCIQTARNMFGPMRCLYFEDGLMETRGPFPCNARLNLDELCDRFKHINTSGVDASNPPPASQHEDSETLKKRAEACFKSICENARLAGLESIAIVTHHDWLEALTGKSFKNAEVMELTY